MKNVAIFGAQGQLGVELQAEFTNRGYEVRGFDRGSCDITDPIAVDRIIAASKSDVVLNPAAFNQVDLAENEPLAAFQVNALAVRNLALACKKTGARLVHFSTDYVFDGLAGRAYLEEDPTHPLGAYAVSKLAGELYAQAYLDDALIIRTSAVFGPAGIRTARGNFIEMMLKLAAKGGPIRIINDQVPSPTYAPALAARTADLVERGAQGIFHGGGGEPISWYNWAAKIFAEFGVNPQFTPVSHTEFPTPARRPLYSALSNQKMDSLGIAPMPPLEQALRDYKSRRPG